MSFEPGRALSVEDWFPEEAMWAPGGPDPERTVAHSNAEAHARAFHEPISAPSSAPDELVSMLAEIAGLRGAVGHAPLEPTEMEPTNADGAEEAARYHIQHRCPKTVQAFVTKLLEIHRRPAPPPGTNESETSHVRFHRGHLEALDARLLGELPALVLADNIPEILKMPEPLELFDALENRKAIATVRACVIDELNTGRVYLPDFIKQIGVALECHAWGHNPRLQTICLSILEVCDRRYEDFEGKFRNTMAARVAIERCDEMNWRDGQTRP